MLFVVWLCVENIGATRTNRSLAVAIVAWFHNSLLRANKCKFIYFGLLFACIRPYMRWFHFISFILCIRISGRGAYPLDTHMWIFFCTENGVMTFHMIGGVYGFVDAAAAAVVEENVWLNYHAFSQTLWAHCCPCTLHSVSIKNERTNEKEKKLLQHYLLCVDDVMIASVLLHSVQKMNVWMCETARFKRPNSPKSKFSTKFNAKFHNALIWKMTFNCWIWL